MDSSSVRLYERGQSCVLHCFYAAKAASEENWSTGRLGSFQRCAILPAGAGNVLHDAARLLRLLLCKSNLASDVQLQLTPSR